QQLLCCENLASQVVHHTRPALGTRSSKRHRQLLAPCGPADIKQDRGPWLALELLTDQGDLVGLVVLEKAMIKGHPDVLLASGDTSCQSTGILDDPSCST